MVIPNMYDEAFQVDSPDIPDEFQTEGLHILFAGRLIYAKGVETLLRAARRLPADTTIHIVGDGYEREKLEQFAREERIKNVIFHGRIHHYNLPGYYAGADVYVHPPYLPDSCPRAVLEALSYNTPLVVSDIGAPPWMGGDACLTFPPGDYDALADRLTVIYEDPSRRAQLADATHEALRKFKPSRILNRYETGYSRVV
jgi:glycosyltransferase involved in cell wall biosynthesis